ncbi:phosphate regulon sensor protein PhoR [Lachnospiraceae bacterium KM106-2]|nr:phosphate regulon sensor protein PhoR [Lachnospiraceae bacterium KM106-2]
MNKHSKLKLPLVLGLLVVVTVCYWFIDMKLNEDTVSLQLDPVSVNELVNQIEGQYEKENQFTKITTHYTYAIISVDHKLIYQSNKANYQGYFESIRNQDTCVDLMVSGKRIGILVIRNESITQMKKSQKKQMESMLCYLLLISMIVAGYAIYLYLRIIRPFLILKSFAKSVAMGVLDQPLPMDRGNLFGAFTESFDIMRDELKIAREKERLANESKKELVASLSHDIKTPIASIHAISELLVMISKEDDTKEKASTILQKTEQIELLINNLFHSTLEELQQLTVEVEELESKELLVLLENADYEKKIDCTKVTIPDCILRGDKLRLQQVIDNLIQNSYKYAGTDITVSARIEEELLLLSIRDYGKSLTKEEGLLVCEKFYRASNASGKSGAGLGLYISSFLMEKMDGSLTITVLEDGFLATICLSLIN